MPDDRRDDRPEARHLRCFVAVAEVGSVRRAALRLGLAQPTVTEHVRKLESLLGFRVFDRVGRSVVLTEQGRLLLPRARQAVRAVDDVAQGVADAVDAGQGRLTVGAIPTMSPYLLPPVLAKLRAEFPECELVVTEDLTESLLDRLDEHTIEVALLSPPVQHPRIETETLGHEDLLVVAPADRGMDLSTGITLRDLRRYPRISLSAMHCLGAQVESFCARRDLGQQTSCDAAQLETVFELVRLGLGVSLVPAMAVRNRSPKGLCYTRLKRDAPRRALGLGFRAGRSRSALADRFAALVQLEVARPAKRR
ncbi:MAG: LysR family transcriptional regulator [Planctomycetota bacterium]